MKRIWRDVFPNRGLSSPRLSASGLRKLKLWSAFPIRRLAVVERGSSSHPIHLAHQNLESGDTAGSYRTPLGVIVRLRKIRRPDFPAAHVIKNRVSTGEDRDMRMQPGRDAIVSRVIWLRGLEATKSRRARSLLFTFTAHPRSAGSARPASFGCIRMQIKGCDCALRRTAHRHACDDFTKKRLTNIVPAEEPSLLARTD